MQLVHFQMDLLELNKEKYKNAKKNPHKPSLFFASLQLFLHLPSPNPPFMFITPCKNLHRTTFPFYFYQVLNKILRYKPINTHRSIRKKAR